MCEQAHPPGWLPGCLQVLAEVDAAIGDRAPSIDDVKKLAYTRACLGESLRLYPQVG